MFDTCSPPRTFHPLLLVGLATFATVLMGCPEPEPRDDDDATISDDDDNDAADDDATTPEPDLDADNDGWNDEDDCADNNPAINPGAIEVCNGMDDNCDGQLAAAEQDNDLDGFLPCEVQSDCDDSDADVNPWADEVCGNEIDENCDGEAEVCPDLDLDNDGYDADVDCDDTNPNIHPGAGEVCGDGIDQNCDALDNDGNQDCDVIPDGSDQIYGMTGSGALCVTDDVIPFSTTVYAVGYNVPPSASSAWCNTSTAADFLGMSGFGDVYCVYASWWSVGTLLRFTFSDGACSASGWALYDSYCRTGPGVNDPACWYNAGSNSYSLCASVYAGPSGNAFDLGANCSGTY